MVEAKAVAHSKHLGRPAPAPRPHRACTRHSGERWLPTSVPPPKSAHLGGGAPGRARRRLKGADNNARPDPGMGTAEHPAPAVGAREVQRPWAVAAVVAAVVAAMVVVVVVVVVVVGVVGQRAHRRETRLRGGGSDPWGLTPARPLAMLQAAAPRRVQWTCSCHTLTAGGRRVQVARQYPVALRHGLSRRSRPRS